MNMYRNRNKQNGNTHTHEGSFVHKIKPYLKYFRYDLSSFIMKLLSRQRYWL